MIDNSFGDKNNSQHLMKSKIDYKSHQYYIYLKGRFHLYSDTSKYATGSALYQIQNGKPKLIAYASKRLPDAAKKYSITELEMCGVAINITSFAHLLKKVDFDAIVDHLALVHIPKSKAEPATTRIKRSVGCIFIQSVLYCCVTQILYNRIISVSVLALYISSTHSHLYQRW